MRKKLGTISDVLSLVMLFASLVILAPFGIREWRAYNSVYEADHFKVGQVVNLPGLANGKTTLVLGISPACSVCQKEVPFYQKLAAMNKIAAGEVQVLAILPEDISEAKEAEWMRKNHIPGTFTRVTTREEYPFTLTPTLLLVDGNSKIIDFWRQKLTPDKEAKIIKLLM